MPSYFSFLCATMSWDFRSGIDIHLDCIYFFCQVCRRVGDPNRFMFCKRCDDAYHCYCQQPPHKVAHIHLTCFILIIMHAPTNPLVFSLHRKLLLALFCAQSIQGVMAVGQQSLEAALVQGVNI